MELKIYEKYVEDVMKDINPIRTEQLVAMLKKLFPELKENQPYFLLSDMQDKGYLLMSKDGWSITKGKYLVLFDDTRFQKVSYDKQYRLEEIDYVVGKRERKLVDCFWILLNFLTRENFYEYVVTNKPYHITLPTKTHLVEIIRINEEEEQIKKEMMVELSQKTYSEEKLFVRRIVVLDRATHTVLFPNYIGIKYFAVMDETTKEHYRIVEKRDDDTLWKTEA